jgi:hypothetical protein
VIGSEKEFDSCIRVVCVFSNWFNENRNPDRFYRAGLMYTKVLLVVKISLEYSKYQALVEFTSRVSPTHYPRWYPCKSQPDKMKSQPDNTNVSRLLAGEKGYVDKTERDSVLSHRAHEVTGPRIP